jgi:hypothetical protein
MAQAAGPRLARFMRNSGYEPDPRCRSEHFASGGNEGRNEVATTERAASTKATSQKPTVRIEYCTS